MRALAAVAQVAPGLSEAELRVLLELASRAIEAPDLTIRASSRELAKCCNMARSNVQKALDSLAIRSVILVREGTATKASAIRVSVLEVLTLSPFQGGPTAGPPPASLQGQGGPTAGPPPASLQGQGGPTAGPPPVENTLFDLSPPPPSISKRDSIEELFDRLAKTSPKNVDETRLLEAQHLMHHYRRKMGGDPNVHPPDQTIAAFWLAVAPWPVLLDLIRTLMEQNVRPGDTYAWFLTVAIQRIHGISPQQQKQHRAALRMVGRARPTPATSAPAAPPAAPAGERFDMAEEIEKLARAKSMSR